VRNPVFSRNYREHARMFLRRYPGFIRILHNLRVLLIVLWTARFAKGKMTGNSTRKVIYCIYYIFYFICFPVSDLHVPLADGSVSLI
jgi:hypothetical protein